MFAVVYHLIVCVSLLQCSTLICGLWMFHFWPCSLYTCLNDMLKFDGLSVLTFVHRLWLRQRPLSQCPDLIKINLFVKRKFLSVLALFGDLQQQTGIIRCTPKCLCFRLFDNLSWSIIAFIWRQCYFVPSICLVEVPIQIRGYIWNKLFTLCSHVTEYKWASHPTVVPKPWHWTVKR